MNYIIVKGEVPSKVERAAAALTELYADSGLVNSITIARVDFNHYMVTFPGNPDFNHFAMFVNYLRYPEGIHNFNPTVYGVWQAEQPVSGISTQAGESLLVYISVSDSEYDNVFIENASGKIVKYSFNDSKLREVHKSEMNYKELVKIPETYEEYIEIVPAKESHKYEVSDKSWWKFW